MYEELREAVAKAGGSTGAWEEQLSVDEREALPMFQAWLTETDGKAESTAGAYRGYVAQAIVRLKTGEEWKALSTDIRSAVRAFIRFGNDLALFNDTIVDTNVDPDVEEE